jgi:hypothetical protein
MPVAITAVQRLTGDPYVSQGPPASGSWSCPAPACAWGGREQDGSDAATVTFDINPASNGPGGFGCMLYLARTMEHGWQYVESSCGQNLFGPALNAPPTVWVSVGCANLRAAPSLTAAVNGCVATGSLLPPIDQGPVYADSHLWWHSSGGWIAQDFLFDANQGMAHSVADDTFPRDQFGNYVVCGETGDPGSCPYTARLKQRLIATRATLCRCQNPFSLRLIGADPTTGAFPASNGSWIAHILGNEEFDLVLVSVNGRLLVDDERCLGAGENTSIYVSTDGC